MPHLPPVILDPASSILRLNWSGKDDQVAYEWEIVGAAPKTPAEARKHQVSDAMICLCPRHSFLSFLDRFNDDLIVVFVSQQKWRFWYKVKSGRKEAMTRWLGTWTNKIWHGSGTHENWKAAKQAAARPEAGCNCEWWQSLMHFAGLLASIGPLSWRLMTKW